MGAPEEHSKWSASSFHRRVSCPASYLFEQQFENVSSVYADEGTAAHTLASTYMQDFLKNGGGAKPLHAYVGDVIPAGERTFKVTPEMVAFIEEYTDAVLIEGAGLDIYVEEKVNYSRYLDVPRDDAWGTADAIIVDLAKRHITIKDLKYGFTPVDAEQNEQMMLYALGVVDEFSFLGTFDTVTMCIHQPRLQGKTESRWENVPVRDLEMWAVTTGQEAVVEAEQPDAPFGPTEKGCQFCNGRHACAAKRTAMFAGVTSEAASVDDFDDLTQLKPGAGKVLSRVISQPGDLTDEQLLTAFKIAPLIEAWPLAIRAEVERRAFAGKPIPGTKVVTGKQGDRKWNDEEKAEQTLAVMLSAEAYTRKIVSPTVAEKLLKKRKDDWEKLQPLISRAPGKPSVALETDPREAISLQASPDDFDDVSASPDSPALPSPGGHPFRK